MNTQNNSPKTEIFFRSGEISRKLDELLSLNIHQLSVRDHSVTGSKNALLRFIDEAQKKAPHVLFDFSLSIDIIDREVLDSLSSMYCSLSFPIDVMSVQAQKKTLSKKAAMLNDVGLVFGFDFECGAQVNELSYKILRDTVDFLAALYPNHLYFSLPDLRPTTVLSLSDIKKISSLAYASEVFYTKGRAVPWFLIALKPLKITPSVFFLDFAEWLVCNNADISASVPALTQSHKEIEKMQLIFLQFKYEEKRMGQVYLALSSLIQLHGAFSRVVAEDEETTLLLDYYPDDLLGPDVFDIASFVENVCMEQTDVLVFAGEYGPDFKVL